MDDIELGNVEKLRVVKTLREEVNEIFSSKENINNHIIFKKIEPNKMFFKNLMILRNYNDGRIKFV